MFQTKTFRVGFLVMATAGMLSAVRVGLAEEKAGGGKIRVLLTADGSHGWAEKEPLFMEILKKAGDFEVTRSGDFNDWLADRIGKFDLVVVHTTRGTLTDAQTDGLIRFVENGGGFVGIHSATDSFRKNDRYWRFIGGRFTGHQYGTFGVEVTDPWHPIMSGVQDFQIEDEDYQHSFHAEADLHVLAQKKDDRRAMAWVKKIGKGRLAYLANGHGVPAFKAEAFQRMLTQSLYWAARRPVPGSGYVSLFDGTNLKQWRLPPGQASWEIEDGLLVNKPGHGGSLHSAREYSDFVIRLDWKLNPGGNSGVYIRSGTEIQILDDFAPVYAHIKPCQHAGSVYCQIPAKPGALKKAGQWNEMQILARGKKVMVWLNGQVVVDGSFDDTPELKTRAMRGYIILQYHGGGLWFRDIEIKPLSPQ